MAEPITIGSQTFIKTAEGWVDQKSKVKAPEGLLKLLNNLQQENSPEGKRKRVRIDTSRPVVKLGKTEYVWDLNSNVWIDKKTKDAANPAFSKLIEAAYQSIKEGITSEEKLYKKWAETAAKGQVFSAMGSVGQAGRQKVKKPSGGGQLAVPNIKINSPIIQMIEKLSVIDGYLKQRLANDIALTNSQSVSTKEQAIEQSDATPNLEEENVDAEVEKTNKESQAILVAGAVAAGALIISQLDPIKETFNAVIDFAKGVYNFASGIAGAINEGLVRIVGTPESRGEQAPNADPAADASRASDMTGSTSSATGANSEDTTAFSGPGSASGTGGQAASGAASAEEILTAFPGPTTSSNAGRTASSPDATSVAAAAGPAPATPAQDATANTPTRLGRAALGAATGFALGGVAGATVGAVTGFFSSAEDAPAASTPAPQATRTTAPSPVTTDSIPKNDIVALGNYLVGQGAEKSKMEHLTLSGRVGKHVTNSDHYRGMAIDVNFPGSNEASLLDALEPQLRAAGYNTIWRKKDHYTHMHVSVGGSEGGDSYGSGESTLQQVATAGIELTKGAMEAIGTILRAGLGSDTMRVTSGSQLSTVNDTMSGNIARASRERAAETAAARTQETAATSRSDPMNLNAPTGSSTIQNLPSSSDKAGVEFYLTRMGFPKITYNQNALAGMRA